MSTAVSRYGFINAKLRARIGALLDDHLIRDMIRSGSLVEAVQVLRDTQYQLVAQAYDKTGDIQQMELVLLQGEVAMYDDVAKYLEGKPSKFIHVLLEKIEIDNLKNAIRLWYSNVIRHHSISFRASYIFQDVIVHPIDWASILNAVDWNAVVASVKDTPYHDILKAQSLEQIEKDGLFELEMELDKLWFARLNEQAKHLCSKDRKTVKEVYDIEIDLKNVLILVRFGWYHKLSSERLKKLIIPGGTIANSHELDMFLSMDSAERNPSMLLRRRYADLARQTDEIAQLQKPLADSNDSKLLERKNEVIAAQTLQIEEYLGRMRRKEFTSILSGYPFTIGVVLAYFFLYKHEDQMIRAVISGKYYGWSEDRIREVMV